MTFEDECLVAHNKLRKLHGVPALTYNKDIGAIAQKWADTIVKTGKFEHSKDRNLKGEQMGENIAMNYSSNKEDKFSGEQVTKMWYDEIKDYDFKTSKSNSGTVTGHFTQVVWKNSKELGVGRAQAKDGTWYYVANYLPPGNYCNSGQFEENVLSLKK